MFRMFFVFLWSFFFFAGDVLCVKKASSKNRYSKCNSKLGPIVMCSVFFYLFLKVFQVGESPLVKYLIFNRWAVQRGSEQVNRVAHILIMATVWLQISQTSFIDSLREVAEKICPILVYPELCTFIPLSFVYTILEVSKSISTQTAMCRILSQLTSCFHEHASMAISFSNQRVSEKLHVFFIWAKQMSMSNNMFFLISTPCQIHNQHAITRFVAFQASFGCFCGAFAGGLKTGNPWRSWRFQLPDVEALSEQTSSKTKAGSPGWMNLTESFSTQKFRTNAILKWDFPKKKRIQDCNRRLESGYNIRWFNQYQDPRNMNYPWNS